MPPKQNQGRPNPPLPLPFPLQSNIVLHDWSIAGMCPSVKTYSRVFVHQESMWKIGSLYQFNFGRRQPHRLKFVYSLIMVCTPPLPPPTPIGWIHLRQNLDHLQLAAARTKVCFWTIIQPLVAMLSSCSEISESGSIETVYLKKQWFFKCSLVILRPDIQTLQYWVASAQNICVWRRTPPNYLHKKSWFRLWFNYSNRR